MMNSVAWLIPIMVMSSPSATVLLNTRSPLLVSVNPSLRPRGLSRAAVCNTTRFSSGGLADARAESSSDDDVDVADAQPVDHRDEVLDAVLTVGVEGGEDLSAGLAAGVLDAGLDGRTLAQVHRVAHQMRPGPQRDVAGVVAAAVVHAHDVGENRAQIGDDVADDAGFVEGWDDDPDVERFTEHFKATTYTPDRPTQPDQPPRRASAARCTPIPTSGPHSSATTVRVSSGSGNNSNSVDATVAQTQPSA